LALVMVEVTDMALALDSIPAIFSVTREPLIVYSSTMFAVLGLRSLYFLLAGVTERLRYLHTGLAAILIFVGAKMLVGHFAEIPAVLSLGVVCGILLIAVFASLQTAKPDTAFVTRPPKDGHPCFPKECPLPSKPCDFATKLEISKQVPTSLCTSRQRPDPEHWGAGDQVNVRKRPTNALVELSRVPFPSQGTPAVEGRQVPERASQPHAKVPVLVVARVLDMRS
jgi:hypothetical protein